MDEYRQFCGASYRDYSPDLISKRYAIKYDCYKDYTFIILGRPGPTGKTWLCNRLKSLGFNAIEICDRILDHVEYKRSANYFTEDPIDKIVVIILNRQIMKGE